MSSQSNQGRLSLNKISNNILNEQNIDIALLTRGHLNERHLWKPLEARTHQPWEASNLNKKSISTENKSSKNSLVPKLNIRSSIGSTSLKNINTLENVKLVTLNNNNVLKTSHSGGSLSNRDFKLPPIENETIQNSVSNSNTPRLNNILCGMSDKEMALKILSSQLNGVNKQEKFKNLSDLQRDFLKIDDLLINNVLHNNESALYLENKLNRV
jgi:hypothetical protein